MGGVRVLREAQWTLEGWRRDGEWLLVVMVKEGVGDPGMCRSGPVETPTDGCRTETGIDKCIGKWKSQCGTGTTGIVWTTGVGYKARIRARAGTGYAEAFRILGEQEVGKSPKGPFEADLSLKRF